MVSAKTGIMKPAFPHRRVAIDFDGTLFRETGDIDRDFADRVSLEPLPNSAEVTKWLSNCGFEILIFTCRPDYHRTYLESLLHSAEISWDYILFYTKPRVDLYIDNKGFRFTSWALTRQWIATQIEMTALRQGSQQPSDAFRENLVGAHLEYFDLEGKSRILDIGCGDGSGIEALKKRWPQLLIDGVEIDSQLRESAKARGIFNNVYDRMPDAENAKYEVASLFGVLEHVDDPVRLLEDAANVAGEILLSVPNGQSFHRIFGQELGIIQSLDELGAHDVRIGHKCYFTPQTLRRLLDDFVLHRKDWQIDFIGSASIKFSTNSEMEKFADRSFALNRAAERIGLVGRRAYHGAELIARLVVRR